MHLNLRATQVQATVWIVLITLNILAITTATVLLAVASLQPSGQGSDLGVAFIQFLAILLVALVFVQVPRNLLRTATLLRAAAAGDTIHAPPVIAPLSPEGALADGETLTLQRRVPSSVLARNFGAIAILVGLIVAVSVLVPTPLISSAITDIAFIPSPTAVAEILPFALVGIPLISGIGVLLYFLRGLWGDRQYTITADDAGITVRATWQRPRFIAWADIKVIIRSGAIFSRPELMRYLIRGEQHDIALDFAPVGVIINSTTAARTTVEYVGGAERYAADARRLLATIAARAPGAIVCSYTTGFYGRHPQLRTVGQGLTLAEVATFPVAEATAQPDPTRLPSPFVQSMWATTGHITLWPASKGVGGANLRGIILIVFVLLIVTFSQIEITTSSTFIPQIVLLSIISIILVLGLFAIFVALPLQARTNRRRGYTPIFPIISADNVGLSLTQPTTSQGVRQVPTKNSVIVPWGSIRAWAVLPPSPAKPSMTVYCVFSDGVTLHWLEPSGAAMKLPGMVGDPKQAFAETATALHAMIASRTGQPLRVLPQPRGW